MFLVAGRHGGRCPLFGVGLSFGRGTDEGVQCQAGAFDRNQPWPAQFDSKAPRIDELWYEADVGERNLDPDAIRAAFASDQRVAGSEPFVDCLCRPTADPSLVLAELAQPIEDRSEERRVGKECVSTCRSRWSPVL